MTTPIVELKDVSVQFGHQTVHKHINLKIREGESVVLLGPSGIGKTIILKLIMGLISPTSGEVWVRGTEIGSANERVRHEIRAQVGMLFQGAALFDSLTVYENIAYSLRERKSGDETFIKNIVEERLEMIGLPEVAKKYPGQLSGGQKKRVGLARALASSPKIMLFDEPTTGLDPTATRMIDDLIVSLKTSLGMTCISVTHDIASARRIAERWLLINSTGIIADGATSEVLSQSSYMKHFVNGSWDDSMTDARV